MLTEPKGPESENFARKKNKNQDHKNKSGENKSAPGKIKCSSTPLFGPFFAQTRVLSIRLKQLHSLGDSLGHLLLSDHLFGRHGLALGLFSLLHQLHTPP